MPMRFERRERDARAAGSGSNTRDGLLNPRTLLNNDTGVLPDATPL
jgi:hypothetical protein